MIRKIPFVVLILLEAACLPPSSAEKIVGSRGLQIGGGGGSGGGIGNGNGNGGFTITGNNGGSENEDDSGLQGMISATFETQWQLELDLDNCLGDFATKTITCTNGKIDFLEGLSPNVECVAVGDDTLECSDATADFFVNSFSGARFTCTAEDAVPEAKVEYASVDSMCQSAAADTVSHYVQLGVDCADGTNYSGDLIDCGEENTSTSMEGRPTCGAVAQSANGESVPTGVAQISTNTAWTAGDFEGCFAASDDNEPAEAFEEPVYEPVPGTTYSAQYQMRFKRILSDGCEAPEKDLFAIECPRGKLDLLDVSDDAFCLDIESSATGEYVVCETTCRGSGCEDVYVDRNFRTVFGQAVQEYNYIEFNYTCSALDDVNGVDSYAYVLGTEFTNEGGSCVGEAGGASNTDGFNFLTGELNVMCESENGFEYVNDDAFTECDYGDDLRLDGRYICRVGSYCSTESCRVTYEDLDLIADHHRFKAQQCITTDNGSGVPPTEVILSDIEPYPAGDYIAVFQLGSAFFFDEDHCTGGRNGIRIECTNGNITLKEANVDKKCAVVSDSVVECIENNSSVTSEFVEVAVYECNASGVIPTTKAEYFSTDATCDSATDETVTRYLNLGVGCEFEGSLQFVSEDYFFECGVENTYTTTTDDYVFSCFSTVEIPKNTPDATAHPVDKVEIFTDFRWDYFAADVCYVFKPTLTDSAAELSKSMVHDSAAGLSKPMVHDGRAKLFGGGRRGL